MEIKKLNTLEERDFLLALLVSDKCCQILIPFTDPLYFDIDYAKIVVRWVVEYYEQFKRAPKKDILSVYRLHCMEIRDDATRDLVLDFLQKLSEQDTDKLINNEDYTIDRCRDFLEYRKLSIYSKDIQACLDLHDVKKARKLQEGYKKVSVAQTNEASLLASKDIDVINTALHQANEPLITLPGAISNVFGVIKREDFVAVCAGMKMGKSFCLADLAMRSVLQGKKVIFVSLEMSREEVLQRLWTRYCGMNSPTVNEGHQTLSQFVQDESYSDKFRVEQFDFNVVKDKSRSLGEQQERMRLFAHGGDVHVLAYPAFSVNMGDITQRVEELAADGFVPDVLIVDYIDITKPSGGGDELRNQLDYNWKVARAFAQKLHIAVITATQTNRGGLGGKVSADNVAEDIRKLAHVTSMVAIERTPAMKKQHLCRLRNLAVRNSAEDEPAVFCQALGLGQFVFGKAYPESKVIMKDDSEDD